jgi:multidrug efflux pump subunit AcrB
LKTLYAQCNAVKAQFDLREILLPKAYAFTNACIYVPAQNPEQAARDYIQAAKKELERQIAELREQAKEKQLKINSKPDAVAALENKVNQMKQAITGNSAGSENASNLFREERQRVLFDAAEKEFGAGDVQEARRLYVKHAVNGELSELRNLPPDERKLITQFHQAANKVNSSIQRKSDREILAQLQGELRNVTEESMRAKDAIEPEIKR